MASEGDGVEIDPHQSGVARDSDETHVIEEGIRATPPPQQEQSSTSLEDHSVLTHSAKRSSRPAVSECLHVPEEEMADLSLDVYNMFFLSNIKSQAFFYSLAVLVVKMSLYVLLLTDLRRKHSFPFERDLVADPVVIIAQFFLIPVAIVTQEELITSFFIFSHLTYSPDIQLRHPGAKLWKFIVAHSLRFVDGFVFLMINTVVMLLQTDDVLALFLNFAALMFLQTIDNIALQVAVDGYWTRSLQEAAQDVVDMKFVKRHHYVHNCIQTSFVVLIWGAMLAIWANVHYGESHV